MPIRCGRLGSGRFRDCGEQPLVGELLLQLLEGQLERAVALGLDRLHQQLVFAPGFVDVDPAARQHRDAILRLETEIPGRGAEARAAKLRGFILQGEVVVAAGGELHARNLPGDPNILEAAAEKLADGSAQLGHGVHPPAFGKVQVDLFHTHEKSGFNAIQECWRPDHFFLFDRLAGPRYPEVAL